MSLFVADALEEIVRICRVFVDFWGNLIETMMFDVDVTETYSLFCTRLRNFENNEVFFWFKGGLCIQFTTFLNLVANF